MIRTARHARRSGCTLLRLLAPSAWTLPLAVLLLACLGHVAPSGATGIAAAPPAVHARPLDGRQLVRRLYEAGQPAPRWLDRDGEPARLALELLRTAPLHGLQAADYGADELARRFDERAGHDAAAEFERALSAAMLQFLADLHFGRIGNAYRPRPVSIAEFDPVEALRRGYAKGDFKFVLDGERLTGSWVLVRTRRGDPKRAQWLLIKHRDDAAEPGSEVVEEYQTSVTTGRTMDEIAAGRKPRTRKAGRS